MEVITCLNFFVLIISLFFYMVYPPMSSSAHFFFLNNNFIYLFLAVLGLCCYELSLVVASWDYSLVAVSASHCDGSLVAEHGL